ncbi:MULTISPECIES: DNA-binding protein [Rhodanobacteraceae]|jgi:chromosome segregation ATPase|uniref:Replication region DNA-binding N-term n=1 Tax=Rhodanobacter glycinis TaxID=582702 RepID=A0A1I3YET4_9GAMM|nr:MULTISPECIES: DNA-binding protein [Rhodanobacter]EIL89952.1 putative cointegrase resolution protein [Rhodanobacter sp. 115]SFK29889.1 replication region DNA-binding N-term [Rhodanobacter glycinis]
MSRVSDTRQRTRETAAALVADGRRPHELTVDLIYAAIQQGSRTTINDELKLWKDERAKADAVGADLPPAIADAMRSLWVAAVEQGEKVFNEHRQALESDLDAQKRAYDDVAVERDAAQATVHQLQHEVSQLREQGIEVQQQLTRETEAKRDALGQVQSLQHEVAAVRTDMAQQLEAARQAHDRLTTEFQATVAARDATFQVERDKANARVEAAQARMLQETDAAREGQRQAEQQLAKLRQRSEDQQTSLTELRLNMARIRRELADGEARLAAMTSVTGERDQLALELAATRGQVSGLTLALQSAEARAVAAESQLTVGHKRRQSKQK